MTAQQLFDNLFNAFLVVMLLALLSSLGMSFTVAQIVAPLRRVWVIVATLAMNCLLVPAICWGICIVFPLTNAQTTGIMLAFIASAGPAWLMAAKLTRRADMALAISVTIVLQIANIVAVPLWANAIVSGATVSPWLIIKDLCFLVLIPLAVGIVLRARYEDHSASWKPELERIANIALVFVIAFGVAANWKLIVDQIGSWVIIVSIVTTLVATGLGTLIGLRDAPTALSAAMVTGFRFPPIGLVVISTQLDNNPDILAPALVYSIVYTFLMLGLAAEIGRYLTRTSATPSETPVGAVADGV